MPVPRHYERSIVEFTDAVRGYAQFIHCGNPDAVSVPALDCSAILLTTADGGRSWQRLRHPEPLAKDHQLYAGAGTLALLAEPHGWYVSADAGRTFRHEPVRAQQQPAAVRALNGRFQLCCDGDSPPQIGEWVGDRFRPVPAQRRLVNPTSVAYDQGRLYVAGVAKGRVEASWSHDEGRTWRATVVSEPEGELSRVQLAVGRGDAWLIGYGPDDPTVFPQLWRAREDRWEKVDVRRHPRRLTSVVPLGAGLLAVTGPSGSGMVSVGDGAGVYNDVNWPIRDTNLRLLPDGTLLAGGSDGTAWLGSGLFGDWRWIKLVLDRT